jgi:hypothetical protein
MSWKPTITALVLALIAAGGAAFVWRSERLAGPSDTSVLRVLAPDQFKAERVDRITLERREQPRMVFQRGSDGRWMQIEPLTLLVDQFSIQQFIDLAADLKAIDVIDPARTPEEDVQAAFGFSPPEAVVTYASPDGETRLEFGGRMFAGRGYVRKAGGDLIHVVDQALSDRAVTMDAREWRDRTIFDIATREPRRIVREAAGRRMLLEKQGRSWVMLEPSKTRLDGLTMESFIAALARARCSSFIVDEPQDLGQFGLDRPIAALEISAATDPAAASSGSAQRLIIGAPVGLGSEDRFAMIEGRPMVIQVSESVLTALFQPPEIFVEPTATGTNPADVKTIRIHMDRLSDASSGAAGTPVDFQLQRELERWIAPEHANIELPATPIEELLKQLTEVRAEEIAFQPMPREAQMGFITLVGFDGAPRDTVRVARDPASGKWWLDNGDDVIRVYPAAMELKLSPGDYGLPAAE